MTADLAIIHSATMWIERHGDKAIAEARRLAAAAGAISTAPTRGLKSSSRSESC
jgi:hypothetical protein